ncbi:MAG: hypothetical protein ACREN5_13780 [Gemmatimonadales bacterium]
MPVGPVSKMGSDVGANRSITAMARLIAADFPMIGPGAPAPAAVDAGAGRRYISPIVDRSTLPTRKRRLQDPEDRSELARLTPGARLALVWPLTLQAWAFFQRLEDEPRLRRDVVRVTRRGR